MWSIEDIEAMNPADLNQTDSFLHHVLRIGAANESMLCDAASLLEERGSPYVAAFAQLPFVIKCGSQSIRVPGWREDVVVDLSFTPTQASIDETGHLRHLSAGAVDDSKCEGIWYTQVTAMVRLWSARARLHKTYLNCVSHKCFRNEVIGRVEGWMDTPEAEMSVPARLFAPLTAAAFQAEVTRRIRTEVHSAIRKFIRSYCVANLIEYLDASRLFGYFSMIAPGRIACASPPIPIVVGLCATGGDSPAPTADVERTLALLHGNNRTMTDDRILTQLMAMNRLLHQGEPELALIGCVTAIESFLNDKYGHLILASRGGRPRSASVAECLKSKVLEFLKPDVRTRLQELGRARNAIVHGPPPLRSHNSRKALRHNAVVSKSFVSEGLFFALALYKEVNVRHQDLDAKAADQ